MIRLLELLLGAAIVACWHYHRRAKEAEFKVEHLERALWMELPEPDHFASWDDLNSE